MRGVAHRTVEAFRAEGGTIGAGLVVVAGTAEDQVALPGGADVGRIVGITIDSAAVGETIQVCTDGVADLTVNAASPNIGKRDFVGIHGTTGRGKLSALANTNFVVGQAIEAASADGVKIAVQVRPLPMPAA